MSREIELKLRLSPRQARRFAANPLLAGLSPEKSCLFNTYFDTPDLELYKRGIALRLRRKGSSVWLMTVKGGESGAGGLAQRREWEAPTQPGCFDFSIVGDTELRAFLEARQERLAAIFTTDFTRTAWLLKTPDATLELALDYGEVKATTLKGDRKLLREALCEVEIELLEGRSTDVLFDVAIRLATDFQLHPEIVSKAERGYALAGSTRALPVKAYYAKIDRGTSPVEAFRAVASSCLIQLQRNEAGAVAGDNPEYLHQARVAIRRLRSAFRVFRPVLSEGFLDTYLPRWKALSTCLGEARDWDVFLADSLLPLEAAFPGNPELASLRRCAEANRQAAVKAAAGALTQVAYSRLLLAFSAALLRETEPTIARGTEVPSASDLRRFAVQRLQKRSDRIVSLARESASMSVEQRHRLRIEFKQLRYTLEFFTPILPRARLARYQTVLARIQEVAGRLNDQAMAVRLIQQCRPGVWGESLIGGWFAGQTQVLLSSLDAELRRFMRHPRAW